MKSKFYRWMKQLFVLGVVLFGCMAPLSVKAGAPVKIDDYFEFYFADSNYKNYKNNGYYVMSRKYYTKNGSKWELDSSCKYSYDKRGNIKKIQTSRSSMGTSSDETSYEYQYDKRGNVLSQKRFIDNELNALNTYTYDKKGNVKTRKYYSYINGEKSLSLNVKCIYKNGKLYKEKAYMGNSVYEYIYRPDGTMKSSTVSSDSRKEKSTYDKYGNTLKETSVSGNIKKIDTCKNTYKHGVLSSVSGVLSTITENGTGNRVTTTTYYTSGFRKGQIKKFDFEDSGYREVLTYKYKADKTGKNIGEVISYTNGTANHKICYTWKKIKK